MRNICLYILFCLLPFVAATARTAESIPNVQAADATRFVSDPDNLLSPQARAQADAILKSLRDSTTVEVAVAIASSIDNYDIDDAATKIFRDWGPGSKANDNGLLLLVDVANGAVIRTGRGIEGVIPDIIAVNLLRDYLKEPLQAGDYDGAIVTTVSRIASIVTDPDNAAELRSPAKSDSEDFMTFFVNYLLVGLGVAVLLIIIVLVSYNAGKKEDRIQRYERQRKLSLFLLVVSMAFIGIPIFAWFMNRTFMKRIRYAAPACPNCEHTMHLVDEVHDNDFLTPAQDTEEKINSVDYDVWLCDNCSATEIIPYVNHQTSYKTCPRCGSRAEVLESNAIVRQPTQSSEGIGERTYYCKNCGNRRKTAYRIAKLASAAPVFIGGGGPGSGGSFGGGFGGGSTGGGGASIRW